MEKKKLKGNFITKVNFFMFLFRMISIGFTIAYLIYLIATERGNKNANIALLVLASIYAIFLAIMSLTKQKKAMRIGKNVYRILRLMVNGFTIAVGIYGIIVSRNNVTIVSVMMAIFQLTTFSIKVIFEISMMITAWLFRMPLDVLGHSVGAVANVFKRRKPELEDHPEQTPYIDN